HARFNVPDDLLHGDDVLRELDNRPPQPAEVIAVAVGRNLLQPRFGVTGQVVVFAQAVNIGFDLALELFDFAHSAKYSSSPNRFGIAPRHRICYPSGTSPMDTATDKKLTSEVQRRR